MTIFRSMTIELRKTIAVVTVTLLLLFGTISTIGAATVHAQSSLLVSNHVLTTRVVRTADGGFFVQDILVGFERGTVSFQTLTQVILPRGNHQLSMALVDPTGTELERINFATVRANGDNWTQSLEGTWRNIRFQRAGVHELILYWQGRAVARFHLVVT